MSEAISSFDVQCSMFDVQKPLQGAITKKILVCHFKRLCFSYLKVSPMVPAGNALGVLSKNHRPPLKISGIKRRSGFAGTRL